MIFPPSGTKCADCGVCEAKIYAGNVPICWHCDADEPCPGPVMAQPEKAQSVETPKEVAPMPLKETKRTRISEETKQAIVEADPSISNYALAKRFGISDVSVIGIRRKAGISTARRGGNAKSERGIAPVSSIAPSANKISKVLDKHLKPFPKVPFTATRPKESEPSSQITVTICSAIGEERATSIFVALAPHLKAIALQAGLQAALEEA